jgi:hypothetical protein
MGVERGIDASVFCSLRLARIAVELGVWRGRTVLLPDPTQI